MFQVRKWPSVILHLDGDAFFASVFQAVNPQYKGKPVITGAERGVATSVSYEAKKLGVPRTMPIFEVKKKFPQVIIVNSDYDLYGLFSRKIFTVLRAFSPTVEEYSIDEGFADLKGLRKPLNMGYYEIGKAVKDRVESLGLTVSVGISLTKTLAKVASNFNRPSGLTLVDGLNIDQYLTETKIEDVWGIGDNTASYLKKIGIKTALDFAMKEENFIANNLTKPFFEIWQELRGTKVFELDYSPKITYKSITRSQTFTPPSKDPDFLWGQLLGHVEEAFEKARNLNYQVGKVSIYLKTQGFRYHSQEIKLAEKTNLPFLIRDELKEGFEKIFNPGVLYRTAGCTISGFDDKGVVQPSLFLEENKMKRAKNIYPLYESGKIDFGTSLFESKSHKKDEFEIPMLEG